MKRLSYITSSCLIVLLMTNKTETSGQPTREGYVQFTNKTKHLIWVVGYATTQNQELIQSYDKTSINKKDNDLEMFVALSPGVKYQHKNWKKWSDNYNGTYPMIIYAKKISEDLPWSKEKDSALRFKKQLAFRKRYQFKTVDKFMSWVKKQPGTYLMTERNSVPGKYCLGNNSDSEIEITEDSSGKLIMKELNLETLRLKDPINKCWIPKSDS